jgi:hypothetical protein
MNQDIVKENEPIHRKPAGMLQRKGSVTTLTQQPTLWLPQGILELKTNITMNNQNYFNM